MRRVQKSRVLKMRKTLRDEGSEEREGIRQPGARKLWTRSRCLSDKGPWSKPSEGRPVRLMIWGILEIPTREARACQV